MIQHYPFEVLPLPYLYDSLEPNINMETMFFHHSKHLAAYVAQQQEGDPVVHAGPRMDPGTAASGKSEAS